MQTCRSKRLLVPERHAEPLQQPWQCCRRRCCCGTVTAVQRLPQLLEKQPLIPQRRNTLWRWPVMPRISIILRTAAIIIIGSSGDGLEL